MRPTNPEFEAACKVHLDRFFAAHPDDSMQTRAMKALRMLRASEKPLTGKPEGWAAGIIYALANDGRFPCGVPNLLNAEFEQITGVSIGTARKRGARVMEIIVI